MSQWPRAAARGDENKSRHTDRSEETPRPRNKHGRLSGGKRKKGGNPRSASPTSLLVSIQQGSVEIGVPTTTFRDLINRGQLRYVRFGDSRRIWLRRSDIEELIEKSVEIHE